MFATEKMNVTARNARGRFALCQHGLVHALFSNISSQRPIVIKSAMNLWIHMNKKHTRNRLKEMKDFNHVQGIIESAITSNQYSSYYQFALQCTPVETEAQCHICGEMESDLGVRMKKCGKCKLTFYCSKKCQKKDWKYHKKLCRPMDEIRWFNE